MTKNESESLKWLEVNNIEYSLLRGGKHLQVKIGNKKLTIPSSPSCSRSFNNWKSQVKRIAQ